MKSSKPLRRGLLWAVVFVAAISLVAQPTAYAISATALKAVLHNTPAYGDDDQSAGLCSVNSGTSSANLNGRDPIEKGFNFFLDKGLNQVQSAALIGNFRIESGNLNPKADNPGEGSNGHYGIAQWDYATKDKNSLQYHAGRFGNVRKYAESKDSSPDDLATQLEFVWMELNNTSPAGDYSEELTQLKTYTTEAQLDEATQYVQDHYEGAPGQATQERKDAARMTYNDYANPVTAPGDGPTTVPAVSGSNASCASVGSVSCDSPGGTDATSALSPVRQDVVCLAEGELAKWDSKQMKPGGDFKTYTQGRDEEWCADFASWIYNQAGYPINPGAKEGNVPAKDGIKSIGEAGERFEFHAVGSYTPSPGDMVLYDHDSSPTVSHVNIVVSVNTNKNSMEVIGGNQGSISVNSQSLVSKYSLAIDGDSGDYVIGYVSPIDGVKE